jgi:hypothetical protein
MQPLALSVIGGLLVSMLLTLLVVPCFYVIVDDMKAAVVGWLVGDPSAEKAAGPSGIGAGHPGPDGDQRPGGFGDRDLEPVGAR